MSGSRQYCVDCGLDGKAVPASVIIDAEPLCHYHNRIRGDHETRFSPADEPEETPIPQVKALCACGCGDPVREGSGNSYIQGHFGKKMTPAKVETALAMIAEGKPQAAVAREVGVSQATICNLPYETERKKQKVAMQQTTQQITRTEQRSVSVSHVEKVKLPASEPINWHTISIDLGHGGEVELSYSGNPLEMSQGDRVFLFGLVDRINAYKNNEPISAPKKFSILPAAELGFMRDMFELLEVEEQKMVVEWLQEVSQK